MPPREELLLILDLTSTILRAGVGVHDLIRTPYVELPTRVGRKAGTTGARVEDFLVGQQLFEAERAARLAGPGAQAEFETVHPLRIDERVGFEVVDWVALEAVFRHAMHTTLLLSRPPLSNSAVLSVPPSLPPSTLDNLHRLLFERLLVPQLLLSTRPFFAAAAAGVTSGVVLDLGYRGEGSELSVVHDNAVLEGPSGLRLPFVDEGACDDWCALQVLLEDPTIPQQLARAKGAEQLAPGELAWALRSMVEELKRRELIEFESKLLGKIDPAAIAAAAAGAAGAGEEEGSFDVAKAIVDGKVNDIVKKKGKGKAAAEEDAKFVLVANPFAAQPTAPAPGEVDLTVTEPAAGSQIRLGPARHRYLEPLFVPSVLSQLAPSASEAASQLGFAEYARFAEGKADTDFAGVHEAIGAVLGRVEDGEVRYAVSEALVIVSSGRIGSIKALPPALLPLLLPFRPDPDSGTLAAIAAEGGVAPQRGVRWAPTPEYFANFKERGGELGVYLGACIMGKLLIGDSQAKLFMTKADYTAHGPAYYRLLQAL
ncbi:hypothetical protein JCM10207_003507 [Rhodosporidiobolus poonsookiae]